jgi:hypothetical protein
MIVTLLAIIASEEDGLNIKQALDEIHCVPEFRQLDISHAFCECTPARFYLLKHFTLAQVSPRLKSVAWTNAFSV